MASKITNEAVKNYFLKFIETEDEGLINEDQAIWYTSNWHRPENNLAFAAKALDEDTLLQVYVHKIRLGEAVGAQFKDIKTIHYPLFRKAYEAFLPWVQVDHEKHAWKASRERFKLLFIYGFDYHTAIEIHQSYVGTMLFSKSFRQFANYQHIPGLLSKPDKFYPYATNEKVVQRIIASLDAVMFMRDSDFVMMYVGLHGALFTLLLSPYAEAKACIQRFKETSSLAGNDAKHLQRIEDFSSRFEKAATDYLNKMPK